MGPQIASVLCVRKRKGTRNSIDLHVSGDVIARRGGDAASRPTTCRCRRASRLRRSCNCSCNQHCRVNFGLLFFNKKCQRMKIVSRCINVNLRT